jgi:prepilin-type N-terminal cleavage/methylation domain-containing protein
MVKRAAMVKMQISKKYDRLHQCGFTLIELLIVLSIFSFATLIAASAINARSPRLVIDQTAEQLVTDLKRARLEAQQSGERIAVARSDAGYMISSLNLDRRFRGDLTIDWATNSVEGIVFADQFANPGGRIEITKSRRRAVILVHAITGKIERIE